MPANEKQHTNTEQACTISRQYRGCCLRWCDVVCHFYFSFSPSLSLPVSRVCSENNKNTYFICNLFERAFGAHRRVKQPNPVKKNINPKENRAPLFRIKEYLGSDRLRFATRWYNAEEICVHGIPTRINSIVMGPSRHQQRIVRRWSNVIDPTVAGRLHFDSDAMCVSRVTNTC